MSRSIEQRVAHAAEEILAAHQHLNRLMYLARGDAELTRRAHKVSELSAVVVQFSRSRTGYERQGLMVEADVLAAAERG